jgi:hypothetical protein
VRPPGSVNIDTGQRTAEEVVSEMESIARRELPNAAFRAPGVESNPGVRR